MADHDPTEFQLTGELKAIVRDILATYVLRPAGTHGVTHWARVLDNGLALAERTAADRSVVILFALYHDSCRINEGFDFDHGRRGADRAAADRGRLFELDDARFALLYDACCRHTDGLVDADITVQACWDADRLDLGRVYIVPNRNKLCTKAARDPKLVDWANQRAGRFAVPA